MRGKYDSIEANSFEMKEANDFFPPIQCICDDERDCNYYTFDVEFGLCSLFATCTSYYDCPSCVTGDEQCWQTLGGDCSLAPTSSPTEATSSPTETTPESGIDKGWYFKLIIN